MDHKATSLQVCMKVFLHGAWHRFTMARLHGACIVIFKLNYKQRHYIAFVLANTSIVF